MPGALGAQSSGPRRVLLISSYHPSFPTFFDQINGIKEGFRDAGLQNDDIVLDIEFMDSKRFTGRAHRQRFTDTLEAKLKAARPYDVILTSDDNALSFALDHQNGILSSSPVVFLGVNDASFAKRLDEDPKVTGVVEAVSLTETLALIEKLTPKSDVLYVIGDANRTSQTNIQKFEAQKHVLRRMKGRILSLYEFTYEDLAERLREIPESSAILLFGPYRDKAGQTKTYLQGLEFIQRFTKAPIFSLWEHGMGHGVLGGKLISHFEQGYVAARLAASVLHGKSPGDIPVVTESPNVFTFDAQMLRAHGISQNDLPAGSKIINKPVSVLDRYKRLLPWLAAFFVIQLLVIAYLVVNVRNRKRAERRANDSEARFRDLAQSSSDWFWEMDSGFRFTYLSERFQEVTGVPASERLGTTRQQFAGSEQTKEERENWNRHLDDLINHRPFKNFEYPSYSGGKRRWVRVSGVPIFDADGGFAGYRGVGSDIQEEMAARQEIIQAREMAEASNRAKSTFLAHMSHELRTPLNGIIGFAEIIREQVLGKISPPKYREYAADIHAAGTHLLSLLNEVLDLSRIEAGVIEIEDEDINIADTLENAVRWTTELADTHEVTVALDLPPNLPLLRGDARRLKQLFINLIANAVKFSHPNGKVDVRAALTADGGMQVEIEDKGIGISEHHLATIREPFNRVESSQVRSFEGVGLGLSIADKIAVMHGARLEIDSVLHEGTRVIATFPRERVLKPHLTVIDGRSSA
jgi:PAS domain S-box-containing protein